MDPSSSMMSLTSVTCRGCGHLGCDLQLQGCGCVLHARCTPLSVVIAEPTFGSRQGGGVIPPPVTARSTLCPICRAGYVTGIRLFPMLFHDLERAVELRRAISEQKVENSSKNSNSDDASRKRSRSLDDDVFSQIQAESSYLMLSHTPSSIGGHRQSQQDVGNGSSIHRTGRWSDEEIKFVDMLVKLFDSSQLPMPHGVKLNDFLGDMLLCKSSRLTKKMKNAKLSTRSYALVGNCLTGAGGLLEDPTSSATLSGLQEHFLSSVSSEATQLELKFNMQKLWRLNFSNLCLQVGYEFLDASDWLQSLEEMEHRANEAEQFIRKARRRRMSQALKNDTGSHVESGVFIAGFPAIDTPMHPPRVVSSATMATSSLPAETKKERSVSIMSEVTDAETNPDEDADDFLAVLELTFNEPSERCRLFSEDYTLDLEMLADPLSMIPSLKDNPGPSLGDCGSFLDEVVSFMETSDIPFQHVDIWVPSFVSDDGKQVAPSSATEGKLRLFHAGHATRSDLDPTLGRQLNEYGVYGTHFSFAPGVGLPGRVYLSGEVTWETGIHNADPKVFERAGGAKVYGIKTALGIPVEAPSIGRVVVAMYAIEELEVNHAIKELASKEISKWVPEPKWKLVIDLGSGPQADATVEEESPKSLELLYYSHLKKPEATHSAPMAGSPVKSQPSSEGTELMHYSHRPRSSSGASTGVISSATTTSSLLQSTETDLSDEVAEDAAQQIASLLGDHMPVGVSVADTHNLVPHFMSLRLLLLRSEDRRSPEENEKLDVIKKSYQGYTKGNGRSGSELACLIAKDWMYLNPASSQLASQQQYQSHVMAAAVDSMVPSGAPSMMPASLGAGPPLLHATPVPVLHANPISFSSISLVDRPSSHGRGSSLDKSAIISPRSRSMSASSEVTANIVPDA